MSSPLDPLRSALAGRYSVERELGAGGMATVYLAEDLKHHRKVAVKVLRPEVAATIGAERFLREIEIAARLSHPHILPLHDSGAARQEDGGTEFLYFVMPYVEGESLRDRLSREKQLPIDEAIAIAREVADALSSAHGRDVVHRDIKPENILLQEGHAIVADFGIARAITVSGGASLTDTGLAIGTPAYMSPEQAAGGEDVDGRSDVYSLGCVLFEMLAGQPPFTGATIESVVYQHLTTAAPPVTNLRPSVPSEIVEALTRALAKTPADRFSRAAHFAEALNRPVSGMAPQATGTVSEGPPGTGPRRLQWRAVTVGLFLGAAVLAAGWWGLTSRLGTGARGPGRIQTLAVLPLVNLSGDPDQEYFADGMTEQLITELTKIGALTVISRTSVMRYKDTDKSLGEIARELGVAAVVEGSALKAGDRVRINAQLIDAASDRHLWAQDYERDARDVLSLQREVARSIAREIRLTLTPLEQARLSDTTTVDPAAHDDYLKGRYYWNKWTEEGFELALRYFGQAIERDPQYAPAYSALASAYSTLAYFGAMAPRDAAPRSRAAASDALEIDETEAEAHVALGMTALFYDRDWPSARRELERSIELNPGSATAHQAYAIYQMWMGNFERASAEIARARRLDPLSLVINADESWVFFFARRYGQAIERALATLELEADFFSAHWALGRTYTQQGSFAAAITELEAAADLSMRSPLVLGSLGEAYAKAGRTRQARQVLDELLRLSERRYVSPVAVAAVHIGLGDTDSAFEWIERAIEERDGPVVYLNVDPLYDDLRSDSRFDAAARRIGLPVAGRASERQARDFGN
jgi:eukaryotic-like serine/threonine-protein kinase